MSDVTLGNFPRFLQHRVRSCGVHGRAWIGDTGKCPDCTGRDKSLAEVEKALKETNRSAEGISAKQYRVGAGSAVANRNAERVTLHGLEDLLQEKEVGMHELERRTGISRKTSYCHRAKYNRATMEQAAAYAEALGVTTEAVVGKDPSGADDDGK